MERRSRTPAQRRPHRRTAPKRAARRAREAEDRMRQEGNRDIVVAMHTMLNVTRANGTIGRRMADARDGYPHRVYITSAHIPELRNIARRTYQDEATFQAAIDEAVQNYLDRQPQGQGYDGDDEDYDEELQLTDFWEYDWDHDQVNYTVDRSNIRYDVQVNHPGGVSNRRSVRDLLARPLRGKPYCSEHMWKTRSPSARLGGAPGRKLRPHSALRGRHDPRQRRAKVR